MREQARVPTRAIREDWETNIASLIPSPAVEFGEFQSHQGDTNSSKLIIASYNIRYAVGQFLISSGLLRKAGFNPPGRRSETVGKNIRAAARAFSDGLLLPAVDILALQEADKMTARAGGHHVAKELAEQLGISWLHVPAGIPRGQRPKPRQWWLDFEEQIGLQDTGDTGVALLSRLSLEEVTRIDLPWNECPWRPRLAVAATVTANGRKFRIYNAHVDPHAAIGGQLEQLEMLLSQADHSDEPTLMPTLILGDFNTLSKNKCAETRRFLESRGYTTPFRTGTPTWRGAGLRLHADWIFVRDIKLDRWGVARPLDVSDHWPIWVEIDLK